LANYAGGIVVIEARDSYRLPAGAWQALENPAPIARSHGRSNPIKDLQLRRYSKTGCGMARAVNVSSWAMDALTAPCWGISDTFARQSKLGARLIVAINLTKALAKLKGEGRH